MPRPFCKRIVNSSPGAEYFKPAGVPMRFLQESLLTLDEFEALRLADFEGLYQDKAAEKMGISRPTFSRTVEAARKKVADALVNGKALRIENARISERIVSGCRKRWRHGQKGHSTSEHEQ